MDSEFDRLREALANRYDVLEEIGRGGMATVYLAYDRRQGRRVAVKVLKPELTQTLGAERFLREIKTAANLIHPHILPLHDSGEAGGSLFYVMPFVKGESLRARLGKEGRLSIEDAVRITREIADALAYAHEEGVIHRDVKPGNIMLEAGHAWLADFGVAQAVNEARDERLTQTGTFVGTPAYMSPEQAAGDRGVTGRSDQYALGCVLYEMLTGSPPFQAASVSALLAAHLRKGLPPVRARRREVPRPLARTLERALAKSPGGRFASAADMTRSLAMAQAGIDGAGLGLWNRWQWLPQGTRRMAVMGLSVVIAGSGLLLAWLVATGQGGSRSPSSLVVLPFRGALTTPAEEQLVLVASDELTRQLNKWDSVTAVPQLSLTGIWFDRGFEGPTLDRIDEGLAVARDLGVGTLVALSLTLRQDSVRLSADRFDPQTGEGLGTTLEVWGPVQDLSAAAAGLAYSLLGLEGSAAEIAELRDQTTVPGALIEYNSGRKALEQWNLREAEERFLAATQLDSHFAMAQHRLALARFWQWEDGLADANTVGEEISRASRAAFVNSPGLPLRDSLHIDAFHSFQAGDYERARSLYRTLLSRDSADVYAWLLRGSVEYHDPWLAAGPTGELKPRSNLNLARRSVEKASQLSPGLQGAYGTVLEIATLVAQTAERGSAPGFEVPRGEFLPPWKPSATPDQIRPFWPVFMDSLVWLDSSEWDGLPDGVSSVGANRLLGESLAGLRRWAAYQSDQARPQHELARLALYLRSRIPGPESWPRADSLTQEALDYATRALALTPDTTSADLYQLANLRLASDDVRGAREAWRSARERERTEAGRSVSPMTSNLMLYSGRPREALKLLSDETYSRRFYLDTVHGGYIDDGGAGRLIQELEILGATHAGGDDLEAALQDLVSLWEGDGRRTQGEIAVLRTTTAPWIAAALSLAPTVLEEWATELDLQDPLWDALRADGDDRLSRLREALGGNRMEIWEPNRSFLLGRVAQEMGDHTLALRMFSRLDSMALGVDNLDPGWGFLALSYLYRGRAHDALGEPDMAAAFYRRFVEAWDSPDTEEFLVEEAHQRLDDLLR